MATGSSLTQNHSRSQSEIQGDLHKYPISLFVKRRNGDCGSPVVKVSDNGRHVMSSSPEPLKTRRVGQRCTLYLSRAETSSRWCGVVVGRGGASVVHLT
ncbi:uncharacterized protein TNCV_1016971 [Trichonephila clavipes]|uniref:Uncharacterized protein n=1 Tax=Trichonephila clavipes TaxID=2585209 RepID=A0A8X6VYD3_TRICX|nr:uncharacterized protein TNCV_1016971 [Trichonephila clavipes]